MKRLTIVAAVLSLSIFLAPNANANTTYGEVCKNFYGPNGSRAVQICSALITDGSNWWGRLQAYDIAGYGEPYVIAGSVNFWSKDNSHPSPCKDDASAGINSCNGVGEGAGDLYMANIPGHITTSHFTNSDHYCTGWAESGSPASYIMWTNGGATTSFDFNSQALTVPPCI